MLTSGCTRRGQLRCHCYPMQCVSLTFFSASAEDGVGNVTDEPQPWPPRRVFSNRKQDRTCESKDWRMLIYGYIGNLASRAWWSTEIGLLAAFFPPPIRPTKSVGTTTPELNCPACLGVTRLTASLSCGIRAAKSPPSVNSEGRVGVRRRHT